MYIDFKEYSETILKAVENKIITIEEAEKMIDRLIYKEDKINLENNIKRHF